MTCCLPTIEEKQLAEWLLLMCFSVLYRFMEIKILGQSVWSGRASQKQQLFTCGSLGASGMWNGLDVPSARKLKPQWTSSV